MVEIVDPFMPKMRVNYVPTSDLIAGKKSRPIDTIGTSVGLIVGRQISGGGERVDPNRIRHVNENFYGETGMIGPSGNVIIPKQEFLPTKKNRDTNSP